MAEHIELYNPSNGQPYGVAPTPKTSSGAIDINDNSNKIATTEWVKSSIAGKNVGDEWFSYTGKIPAGGVPYCGQTVLRSTYSDLWKWVQSQGLVKTESEWSSINSSQDGNVPFYSSGNGSTTFRMPKIVGYIKGASSTDGVGTYTSEGLPNIEGTIDTTRSAYTMSSPLGAFENSSLGGTTRPANEAGSGDLVINFNASLYNSIYGNSEHVTPETITVLFGVYAYGELTVTGSTTTDALASSVAAVDSKLENKLNVSVPHIIDTYRSTDRFYVWYRKWSDGWIEQGGSHRINSEAGLVVTFTVPFSNLPMVLIHKTRHRYGDSYITGIEQNTVTKTGFKLHIDVFINDSGIGNAQEFYWYAYGY